MVCKIIFFMLYQIEASGTMALPAVRLNEIKEAIGRNLRSFNGIFIAFLRAKYDIKMMESHGNIYNLKYACSSTVSMLSNPEYRSIFFKFPIFSLSGVIFLIPTSSFYNLSLYFISSFLTVSNRTPFH